jgi:hypothetical protein
MTECAAGRHLDTQRAGDARRIHERIQRQGARILGRPFEPERREARKFFGAAQGRIDGEPARRQSVLARVAADRAKIRCTEKRRDVGLPVRHELHAETREPRLILHHRRIEAALVEFEHRGVIDDFVRDAVDDFE